ncbi:Acyl-CoA synthetase (AMP-forming)/AMP-acid ligase II [Blastococcus tunisiensis]|uniref:Long-chain-fatty-acid--CoA ligase n=1 Tax=Blastococcus tunisiensis TaxID=1798228 RepID=A0A1I1XBM4_9ACTN|nr:Acyl-CoA synthetase (AMP-forming)/AMP-acid ligase II [Blastococcus sp. DSM 46838]
MAGQVRYRDLVGDVFGLRRSVPPGGVVVLRAPRARTVAAAVLALEGWAARVDLRGADLAPAEDPDAVILDDSVTATAPTTDAPTTDAPTTDAPATGDGGPRGLPTRWVLHTSGTTGEPKAVQHTLASLTRTTVLPAPMAGRSGAPRRWGLLYEPTRMAGLQVLLQAVLGGDVLVDPLALDSLPARLRRLSAHAVDSLSATPTIWRQILQSGEQTSLPLQQVTLGGEIADQGLLDALAQAFPGARVTHVFASTETGAAFSVHDGREGFPRSYLEEAPRGIRLEVRDGVLHVHAPDVSGGGPDGFVSTGDLVEVTGDRVRFLGRASGMVNVAGAMVAPEQVEAALRAHPDVVDAVVTPRRNPFSGWLLVAQVTAAPGVDRADLPKRLSQDLAARLPATHVPAVVRVVDRMAVTSAGKAGRR